MFCAEFGEYESDPHYEEDDEDARDVDDDSLRVVLVVLLVTPDCLLEVSQESCGRCQDQDGGAKVLVDREHQGSQVRRELGEEEGKEAEHPLESLFKTQ